MRVEICPVCFHELENGASVCECGARQTTMISRYRGEIRGFFWKLLFCSAFAFFLVKHSHSLIFGLVFLWLLVEGGWIAYKQQFGHMGNIKVWAIPNAANGDFRRRKFVEKG